LLAKRAIFIWPYDEYLTSKFTMGRMRVSAAMTNMECLGSSFSVFHLYSFKFDRKMVHEQYLGMLWLKVY